MQAFLKGEVLVSYGLLTEIEVKGKYGPGSLVSLAADEEDVMFSLRVLGPEWVTANRIMLFENGQLRLSTAIESSPADELPRGVKWQRTWSIPRRRHDTHLVAIATGPGVEGLHWRTAKPYQPTSPVWESTILGATGAVWLDGDGDGKRQSAHDYARQLLERHGENLPDLLQHLAGYDAAVAAQAAGLYQEKHSSLHQPEARKLIDGAEAAVQQGFREFLTAWRASQIAKSEAGQP